uniref:Uncharacterized protein n=1 Tax=Caenorhabditis japonica TaxID=281687 RepID=A0A8R1IS34_CAEJA
MSNGCLKRYQSDDKYTEMELKILEQLESYPKHYKLYDATRRNNSISTLTALDKIVLYQFSIHSDNLVMPARDTLTAKNLRCLERALYADDVELLDVGAIKFAIGNMADQQHYSL